MLHYMQCILIKSFYSYFVKNSDGLEKDLQDLEDVQLSKSPKVKAQSKGKSKNEPSTLKPKQQKKHWGLDISTKFCTWGSSGKKRSSFIFDME